MPLRPETAISVPENVLEPKSAAAGCWRRAKLAEFPQVTSPLAPCYTKVLRIPRKWGPEIGTGAAVMDVVTDCVTAFKTLRKVSPCRSVVSEASGMV